MSGHGRTKGKGGGAIATLAARDRRARLCGAFGVAGRGSGDSRPRRRSSQAPDGSGEQRADDYRIHARLSWLLSIIRGGSRRWLRSRCVRTATDHLCARSPIHQGRRCSRDGAATAAASGPDDLGSAGHADSVWRCGSGHSPVRESDAPSSVATRAGVLSLDWGPDGSAATREWPAGRRVRGGVREYRCDTTCHANDNAWSCGVESNYDLDLTGHARWWRGHTIRG